MGWAYCGSRAGLCVAGGVGVFRWIGTEDPVMCLHVFLRDIVSKERMEVFLCTNITK